MCILLKIHELKYKQEFVAKIDELYMKYFVERQSSLNITNFRKGIKNESSEL